MKILKQCMQCEGDFYTDIGQLNAGNGKFCCKYCFNEWKKENKNVNLFCQICGKEYVRRLSVAKGSKFCSKECLAKSKQNQVNLRCDSCNKDIAIPKWRFDKNKNNYCSLGCCNNGKPGDYQRRESVSSICDYCGEKIIKLHRDFYRHEKHFCNKDCESGWKSENLKEDKCWQWKGGVTDLRYAIRNSRNYRLWRKECFERENYTCEMCNNRGGYLEVHHIKPFSLICDENKIQSLEEAKMCNELWDTNNGQVLCKACHNNITFNKGENIC